jgi:hypothetical protein
MNFHKKTFVQILIVICLCVLLILSWRAFTLWRLPYDEVEIPPLLLEDKLVIPQRPGIRGIIITGPTIEPLFFSVDLTKSGIRGLNWRQLQSIDPHTDVKINCLINDQGEVYFSMQDVLMEGHTDAGMAIQNSLKTWIYTPFRSGIIRFWFNLPSKGKKLIIDTSGLRRKWEIPNDIPIYNGQLHFIQGIPTNEIGIGEFL